MKKIFKYFTFAGLTSLLLTSCIKDDVNELKDEGKTFIKLQEAPVSQTYLAPFTDVKSVKLLTIRRDAAKNSDLNKAVTVQIKANPAAVEAYNDEHHTDFLLLPEDFYTLGEGVTKNGDTYTVSMAPGEFAKEVKINFNGAKWTDLTAKYALAFTLVDPGGFTIGGEENVISLLSIANKYDGVYKYTATYDVPADRAGGGWAEGEWTYGYDIWLTTTGPNSVRLYNTAYEGFLVPLMTTTGESGFGATILDIVFDENDQVVSVNNPAPDARNRQFSLISGADNYYDEASKTLYLNIAMSQTGFAPIPMHIKMVYQKAR